MAKTRTLTQLRSDIKSEGGWNRSKVFTDALLNRWINLAINEIYELLATKLEGHYVTRAELTLSVGQQYVALPTDFWRLLKLDLKHTSTSYTRLHRMNMLDENAYQDADAWNEKGETYAYYLSAGNIWLSRVPVAADKLRIVYIPHTTDLAADDSTFDGINGWEDLVVQLVLRKCYVREQRDARDIVAEINRQYDRIDRMAAMRDSAEPYPCPDL